jgi:hypothetical protein
VIGANRVLSATPRPDEYNFAHFRERLPAPAPKFVDLSSINAEADSAGTAFSCTAPILGPNLAALSLACLHPPQVEASSGSPVAHINERMIADALIEAGLVTGSRLVERDWAIREVNCRIMG